MKFSEAWLREWVNPQVNTQQLGHQLTMAGLEVDAIEPVAGEFSGVVVGKVLSVAPHPNADKLRVCSVDVGQGDPLSIVCGAANVAAGMHVPAALIGASLPGGLNIKKSKLRGVESSGMLCSAKELGLAESADGLLPLPLELAPGSDVRAALQLDDVSIELGLTPNRGDCLSVLGVAREVAVANAMDLHMPAFPPVAPLIKDTLPIELQAAEDCPRYVGRVIRDIDPAAQTPLWLQERLRRSGLRSISPVVDVTNFVLLELGQPMHAFDLEKLQGGIRVRKAQAGEKLKLLDGQEISLQSSSLVIADHRRGLALAGIMGGEDSAVGDGTRHIFLESAFFQPLAMAGRARAYGMHTDSSHRFERGVDPQNQRRAIERATTLLLAIVGGKPGPVSEVSADAHVPRRASVVLRRRQLARLLGAAIDDKTVESILRRLGMQVNAVAEGWQVLPPDFRFDIAIEADLVEEVARIYGYDNIQPSRLLVPMAVTAASETVVHGVDYKRLLLERGYHEAITYSFVDENLQAALDPGQEFIRLANPISADMSVMRTSLWPGLVQAVRHNQARQQARVRLFETGLRFRRQSGAIVQDEMLAGVAVGEVSQEAWGNAGRVVDFFDIKGDLENLLLLNRLSLSCRREEHPVLHPGQSARLYIDDKAIGWMGALRPNLLSELDISGQPYVFELELAAIRQGLSPNFFEISKFPSVRRDISIVLDASIEYNVIASCVQKSATKLLKKLQCFDVYTGKGIDSGRKSISLGLTFQDLTRTLNDDDVDAEITKVLTVLEKELGGTLRS